MWRVSTQTPESVLHKCPWYGGTTRIAWSVTVTLVEQMWHRLDSLMDELGLNPKPEWPTNGFTQYDDPQEKLEEYVGACEFHANLRGKARGMAEMIAIFMNPHFTDANEVAREAKRRADARARKDDTYETVGLNQRRYEAPPTSSEVTRYKREPSRPGSKLPVTPIEAEKIRAAYGTFPVDMLAKAYKITEKQVKEIAESPSPALQS